MRLLRSITLSLIAVGMLAASVATPGDALIAHAELVMAALSFGVAWMAYP
jgi:hypothetical protein